MGLDAAFGTNANDPQLELHENPSATKTLISNGVFGGCGWVFSEGTTHS